MTSKPYCAATILRTGYYNNVACSNVAKVERDGRWYCGVHDPVAIKRRRDEADQAQRDVQDARAAERTLWNHENSQRRDAALGRLTALRKVCGLPLAPEAPQAWIPAPVDGMKLATETHPRFGVSFTGGLVLAPAAVEFVTERFMVLDGVLASLKP